MNKQKAPLEDRHSLIETIGKEMRAKGIASITTNGITISTIPEKHQPKFKMALEGLRFYAEKENYKQIVPLGYNLTSQVELDNGKLAREIFKKLNKQD